MLKFSFKVKIIFGLSFLLIFSSCFLNDGKSKEFNTYLSSAKKMMLKEEKSKLKSFDDIVGWVKKTEKKYFSDGYDYGFIQFLGELGVEEEEPEFKSFFFFLISDIYWEHGDEAVALFYMARVDESAYFLKYNYNPIGYTIAKRVVKADASFEFKENMLKVLLADFQDMIDLSYTLYELSNLYKSQLMIREAVNNMQKIINLRYSGDNAIAPEIDIREMVKEISFYKSKKKWVCQDLETLVKKIKKAVKNKDKKALGRLVSQKEFKVKHFQKEASQRLTYYELQIHKRWNKKSIVFADALENFSGEKEAYLKSDNWDFPQLPIWYFYFKKIYYPYDSRINGSWEWCGLVFGVPY